MVVRNWLFISFDISESSNVIMPYPVAGWETVYYADLSSRQSLDYYLLISYNNTLDKDEIKKAFQIGLDTSKSVRVYFHQIHLKVIQDVLKELTKHTLRLGKGNRTLGVDDIEIRETVATCTDADLTPNEVTSLLRYEIVESSKEEAIMPARKIGTEEKSLIKEIYWNDLIYKRILFFILLEEGITRELLAARVSDSSTEIGRKLNKLIMKNIINLDDGVLKIEPNIETFINDELFKPEFGEINTDLKERISKVLAENSVRENFTLPIEKIWSNLTQESPKYDDPQNNSLSQPLVFKNSGLYISIVTDAVHRGNTMIPSHIRTLAEQRSLLDKTDFITILMSPVFEPQIVSFVESLQKPVYLLDIVSLIALENLVNSQTTSLREKLRKNLRFGFTLQPFGGLWDVKAGIDSALTRV